jgi:hypothetical protein
MKLWLVKAKQWDTINVVQIKFNVLFHRTQIWTCVICEEILPVQNIFLWLIMNFHEISVQYKCTVWCNNKIRLFKNTDFYWGKKQNIYTYLWTTTFYFRWFSLKIHAEPNMNKNGEEIKMQFIFIKIILTISL